MSIATPIRATVTFTRETFADSKLLGMCLLGLGALLFLTVILFLAMMVGLVLGLTGIVPMHAGGPITHTPVHIMPRLPIHVHVG